MFIASLDKFVVISHGPRHEVNGHIIRDRDDIPNED